MDRRTTRILVVAGCALWIASAATARERAAVTRGRKVYASLCNSCHGPYGRGDGPSAAYLSKRPPDFTNPKVLEHKSDEELLSFLGARPEKEPNQHTPMLIAQVLQRDAFLDALAYIRTLSVPGQHVSVEAGRDIYENFCWVCHGVHGDGNGPAAKNLGEVKPRDFTSPKFVIAGREKEVYRTIAEGAAKAFHGSPYMLEWGTALSPQQIRDVMAYLSAFKKRRAGP